MVTWLLMHEHALSHIMLYDDSRITMRDAQVHVAHVCMGRLGHLIH